MESTGSRRSSRSFAPRRTPASSTCRKQLSSTTAVGSLGRAAAPAEHLGDGGLDAYETTIARFPWLPPPEKRLKYASSHPSTTTDVVCAQLAPVPLPAIAEPRDGRKHERKARGGDRGVLDHELTAVAQERELGGDLAGGARPWLANQPVDRRSGTRRRDRSGRAMRRVENERGVDLAEALATGTARRSPARARAREVVVDAEQHVASSGFLAVSRARVTDLTACVSGASRIRSFRPLSSSNACFCTASRMRERVGSDAGRRRSASGRRRRSRRKRRCSPA